MDRIPPCIYSINAFGNKALNSFADPPVFFDKGTKSAYWQIPPATVCVWPYEEMYLPEVKKANGTYDNNLRLKRAKDYFAKVESDKSLIFYYANLSNPFSSDDLRRYVLVGVSRILALHFGVLERKSSVKWLRYLIVLKEKLR